MNNPIIEPTYLNLDYLFYQVFQFFRTIFHFIATTDFLSYLYSFLRILFSIAAIILIIFIIYSLIRISEVKTEHHEKMKKILTREPEVAAVTNEKWQKVQEHINSTNPNDWKLAIIDADSILDEMVKSLGYVGDNLGERLKQIQKSDFLTLDDAWEAHKVRNKIAHEGSNFSLDRRESGKVIDLYEKVFKEFKYI